MNCAGAGMANHATGEYGPLFFLIEWRVFLHMILRTSQMNQCFTEKANDLTSL